MAVENDSPPSSIDIEELPDDLPGTPRSDGVPARPLSKSVGWAVHRDEASANPKKFARATTGTKFHTEAAELKDDRQQKAKHKAMVNLQVYQAVKGRRASVITTSFGPSASMFEVWKRLDSNGNGFLCRAEFNEVNRQLHVKWDTAAAWKKALHVQALEDFDSRVRDKLKRADRGESAMLELGLSSDVAWPLDILIVQ